MLPEEKRAAAHQYPSCAGAHHRREPNIQFALAGRPDYLNSQARGRDATLLRLATSVRLRELRVHQHPDYRCGRNQVAQQPQSLARQIARRENNAGDIALRPVELVTKPALTGSAPVTNTMGNVEVAVLAAIAASWFATMTATCRLTRSLANAGKLSRWSLVQRYSILTFWPSTKPASLRPLRKATRRGAEARASPLRKNPITGIAGCCARAPSGQTPPRRRAAR